VTNFDGRKVERFDLIATTGKNAKTKFSGIQNHLPKSKFY